MAFFEYRLLLTCEFLPICVKNCVLVWSSWSESLLLRVCHCYRDCKRTPQPAVVIQLRYQTNCRRSRRFGAGVESVADSEYRDGSHRTGPAFVFDRWFADSDRARIHWIERLHRCEWGYGKQRAHRADQRRDRRRGVLGTDGQHELSYHRRRGERGGVFLYRRPSNRPASLRRY